MPMNYLVSPVQQSGSPNVPITESTGNQLQGTQNSLGGIENSSFSGTVGSFPEVISNAVVCSGNLTTSNQLILNTSFISGTSTVGLVVTGNVASGGTAAQGGIVTGTAATVSAGIAANSGGAISAPLGFFFINVPTSGSPWVKVPFYNS